MSEEAQEKPVEAIFSLANTQLPIITTRPKREEAEGIPGELERVLNVFKQAEKRGGREARRKG